MANLNELRYDGDKMNSFITELTGFQKDLESLSILLSDISASIEGTKDWKDFGKEEMETYMKLVAMYGEMISGRREVGNSEAKVTSGQAATDSHITQMIKLLKEHKVTMATFAQNASNKDECITWLDLAQ